MIKAYKEFWRRYVDFGGKSTRSEYWYVVLCNFLVSLLGVALFTILYFMFPEPTSWQAISVILVVAVVMGVFVLALIIPAIALGVRRLRDGGFPWGLIFLSLIPYVGWLVLVVLYCYPTKRTP